MTNTPPHHPKRATNAAKWRGTSHAIAGGFTAARSRRMAFAFVMGLLLALAVTAVPRPAAADAGPAARLVPSAELAGKGRMTYLGFRVFDAELYAPQGQYSPSKPFALKLTYLRNFKGSDIAKRSVDEMRRQGLKDEAKLKLWGDQMRAIFPDVSQGASITGVRDASGKAIFYKDGQQIGSINNPEFSRRFFAIWLGDNTSNPSLQASLTGSAR
jgi:hypothetical protein